MPIKKIALIAIAIVFFTSCGHMSLQKEKAKGAVPSSKADQNTLAVNNPADASDPSPADVAGAATPQEVAGQMPLSGSADSHPDLAKASNESGISRENPSPHASPAPAQSGSGEPESPEATDTASRQEQSSLDEALDFCEVAQSYWQKGELENALEALDKAYSLILEVDAKENAKLIQQKEDLRYLISKRILEIYASRNIVVNGNHDEIPLEMNRHVKAEIRRFNNGEKKFFQEAYRRSGLYRPHILSALAKAGLPEELSWLPLIESGFKVRALSRARALGLWQFIPSTGYKFGLKRNRYVDERIDFIKSTDAAIAYLKELHSIFGDWATVLAAYNCGEGRVLQVIRTQNINYLDNFWDLYERLPMETARYVPRFFATLHLVKNPEKYGLDQLKPEPALAYTEFNLQRQAHLKSIGDAIGIDPEMLKKLNPELRHQILPPEPYSLKIPLDSVDMLTAKLDTIPITQLPQRAYVWHRVRSGETLSTIARRYRSSVGRIMQANNLRRSHFIRAGQRLRIPQHGYRIMRPSRTEPQEIPASGTHYVRKGDSLWIIAKRYGTTVQKIHDLNKLPSSYLYIGQPLKIPGYKTEPLPDVGDLSTYLVKRGDSPFTIAQKHNMPLERLLLINKLHPRSKIYPGQKLYIE